MFKILLKKQLFEVFRSYFYDAKKNKMRSKAAIAAWFVFFVVIVFGVLGGMFAALALTLCDGLASAGAGWLYFAIMAGLAILLGVFGSVFNSYASLFLAKDNDLLLSLPIAAKNILASRLAAVYLLGLVYSATAIVPALIVYWATSQPTAVTVLCGIALFLIVTLVVLCLGCLVSWVVAKLSLRLKNKGVLTALIAVVGIGLYYAVYFWANDAIQDLLLNAALYGVQVKGAAYGIYVFGSVGEGNAIATLICLAVTVAFVALTMAFMARTYLSTITATGKTKQVRYVEKRAKQKLQFSALLGKEFAKFLSSSNYMLNSGFGIVFMIISGITMLVSGQLVNEVVAEMWGAGSANAAVVFAGAMCLMAAINDIAAPSVSLEGKGIWLLQSLPVSAKRVLRAKAAMHFIMTAVPLAFLAACCAITLDLPVLPKVLMCIVPFAFTAFHAMGASFLGVRMANLAWTNEIMPIKQGGAATITLFGGMGIAMVFLIAHVAIGPAIDATIYLAVWAVLLVSVAAFLLRWLDTKGSQLFAEL